MACGLAGPTLGESRRRNLQHPRPAQPFQHGVRTWERVMDYEKLSRRRSTPHWSSTRLTLSTISY
ncbi:hypothetical protein RHMOL_Rhmol01G0335600 [Rhododendron molle]|uniref:Uncharacterized protein n=1 Tax=Rhododendron molle TaxID=49168 RepID=A0ACC0QAD7_RHOML|nr:hypothetical protein RHMOL_Rhmol01G0335600 [Rhododendron molle]